MGQTDRYIFGFDFKKKKTSGNLKGIISIIQQFIIAKDLKSTVKIFTQKLLFFPSGFLLHCSCTHGKLVGFIWI